MTVNELLKIVEIADLGKQEILELTDALLEMYKTEKVGDMVKVKFPNCNKNHTIEENDEMIAQSNYVVDCRIEAIIEVSPEDYDIITHTFLDNNKIWEHRGGSSCEDIHLEGLKPGSNEYYEAWRLFGIEHVNKLTDGERTVYVNPEGYEYARYVGVAA